MTYLADTNVLSEARRGSVEAVGWFRSIDPAGVYISVVTLGEIARGICIKRRKDPSAAARIERWLDWIRGSYAGRILPISDQIAIEWGRIAALRTRGEADALLAATAIVNDLIVVTRNAKDFADTGAVVIDPWDGP